LLQQVLSIFEFLLRHFFLVVAVSVGGGVGVGVGVIASSDWCSLAKKEDESVEAHYLGIARE
jgi:hypothetical protein